MKTLDRASIWLLQHMRYRSGTREGIIIVILKLHYDYLRLFIIVIIIFSVVLHRVLNYIRIRSLGWNSTSTTMVML